MTEDEMAAFQKIQYDYHVRAFGEEIARINFLPYQERRRLVGEMYDHARRHGYRPEKANFDEEADSMELSHIVVEDPGKQLAVFNEFIEQGLRIGEQGRVVPGDLS